MKKFIALLLVVAFVCANTVGCGSPTTPAAKPAGAGAGAGAGGDKDKKAP